MSTQLVPKKKKFSWIKLLTILTAVLPAILDSLNDGEEITLHLGLEENRPGFVRAEVHSTEGVLASKTLKAV